MRRASFSVRSIAVVATVCMVLSGCKTTEMFASQDDQPPLTPAEQQLRDDADTFNETVAGGVVAGAVIGAVLLALLAASDRNSNKGDIARGAMIGAAAGGLLGGVDGYLTAKAQENANNKVRMLNAVAEDVRQDNARLQRIVDNSNRVLADSKERLETIRTDVAAKKLSASEAEAQRQRVEQNLALLQETLETATKKRDAYRDASNKLRANNGNTTEIDNEIARLERQVSALESNVATLDSALEITRVG